MTNKVHAVGVIFEDPEGKILVLRRHKQDPEGETWGLVGGKIDEGEDKFQTAVREVDEEIAHHIEPSMLQFLKTYHWDREDIDLIFEVFKLPISQNEVQIKLEKQENTEFMWSKPIDLYQRKDLMIGLYPILEDNYHIKNT